MPVIYRSHLLYWHVLMRLHMLELSVGKGRQIIIRALQSSAAVVSRLSVHGHLNITRDFGPHARLPGI